VFYVLVLYIFASFTWWATLHVKKNKQIFQDKVRIMELEFDKEGLDRSLIPQTKAYQTIEDKLEGQNWMILGEGLVFLILLAVGTWKIHAGFQKELMLNRQQRNFLLSITHELKSPIAGIKLALQTLLSREIPPNKQRQLMGNSLRDANRLQNLVDNLLMAAKLENETVTFAKEEQNLTDLLGNIYGPLKGQFGHIRRFEKNIEPDLYIAGDKTALVSIFTNLIENAVKYSEKGDDIKLWAAREKEGIKVKVQDTGIGIGEKERKRVFQKFYRIGNEDTRTTKGTGLGLFIVKELVERHKGRIQVKENQPKGSVFVVSFPKYIRKTPLVEHKSDLEKNVPLSETQNK